MTDFVAQVDDWVKKTQQRMDAVFRESAKRVVSAAQSRIPVDTGFARASIRASIDAMPPINPRSHGDPSGLYTYSGGEVALVIGSAGAEATLHIGWTASYVAALEYGHSKQAPNGFVRISAMEWPSIVSRVTAEAKSRAARG